MHRISDHQASYLAHRLTLRRAGDSVDKIAYALADAQVELNPHQIDAALFAFQSPLSKGVILADEVGLGKTIEAGIVMAQLWAERKRRMLVIVPSSLRKQWSSELSEKFSLPNVILEAKPYNAAKRTGVRNPFDDGPEIVITSYNFAKAKADDIQMVPWDLVVMDEAHYLRGVYKPGAKTAQAIRGAVRNRKKLLLTATPLQNNLHELYGLVSVVDEHVFGDRRSFVAQYTRGGQEEFQHLQSRMRPIAKRTLRRQVNAFVPYTKRIPLVQEFLPTPDEIGLYERVNTYLAGEHMTALPGGQRHLITLSLQKLQASSTFALAPTLERLVSTMRKQLVAQAEVVPVEDVIDDGEGIEDLIEEIEGEDLTGGSTEDFALPDDSVTAALRNEDERASVRLEQASTPRRLTSVQERALRNELAELETLADLARNVKENAKGKALLTALRKAFETSESLGAPRKAIIFTEFRRTQDYILQLLQSDTAFRDGVVLFNGSNSDPRSREIYARWLNENAGTDRISPSQTANTRQALVDEFKNHGQIMIATEAAAQGLNLQFCSLVINYDLPWNPQRIEQRIGRCHRYGQKFDVVVVNFLDKHNATDQRVYELLNEKYQLFQGVFGASDEVLGDISSGLDFEKRIAEIYRTARSAEAIKRQFDQLQLQFAPQIKEQMLKTRAQLFEHFDEEVAERLRMRKSDSDKALDRLERDLMTLTAHELDGAASFSADNTTFWLDRNPTGTSGIPLGRYTLPRRETSGHTYRIGHQLAESLIDQAKQRELPETYLTFDYHAYGRKVSVLEQLQGKSGTLECRLVSLESETEAEDYLVVTAVTSEGERLPADIGERILSLPVCSPGNGHEQMGLDSARPGDLDAHRANLIQQVVVEISARHAKILDEEAEKLDAWADDLRASLNDEIRDLEKQIKDAKRLVRLSGAPLEKNALRRDLARLESKQAEKAFELYQKNQEIRAKRDELYDQIETKLSQTRNERPLFRAHWSVV